MEIYSKQNPLYAIKNSKLIEYIHGSETKLDRYYGNSEHLHSYSKLEYISYIILKFYFPIPGSEFSCVVKEECQLYFHNNPSNVVYNLSINGINIFYL